MIVICPAQGIGVGGGEVGVDLIFQAGLEARFLTLGILFFS